MSGFGDTAGGKLTHICGSRGHDGDYVSPGRKRAWEAFDQEGNWYGYFATEDDVVRFLDMASEIDVDSVDRAEVRITEVNRDCPFISSENGLRRWKIQHDLSV